MTQLGSADPYYALDRFSLWVLDKIEIDKIGRKSKLTKEKKKIEFEIKQKLTKIEIDNDRRKKMKIENDKNDENLNWAKIDENWKSKIEQKTTEN